MGHCGRVRADGRGRLGGMGHCGRVRADGRGRLGGMGHCGRVRADGRGRLGGMGGWVGWDIVGGSGQMVEGGLLLDN